MSLVEKKNVGQKALSYVGVSFLEQLKKTAINNKVRQIEKILLFNPVK